jgi:hypothetical protein
VRTAMFDVFGTYLRPINTIAKSKEILKWKNLSSTKSCYKKIFDTLDFPRNPTYMEAILSKVWSDTSKPLDQHVAWAISVVQTILNPKNSDIKITEDIVKYQLSINIVSICNITCKNILKINEILYKNRKK